MLSDQFSEMIVEIGNPDASAQDLHRQLRIGVEEGRPLLPVTLPLNCESCAQFLGLLAELARIRLFEFGEVLELPSNRRKL